MPPRIHVCPQCLRATRKTLQIHPGNRTYASLQAIAPAPSFEQMHPPIASMGTYPPTQPPSHRPPEFRKSQLHRQYTSLLRSTPLMLLFQHNNLKAIEWMGVRRELAQALRKLDDTKGSADEVADGIKVQIIQTGIFAAALRVAEYFHPERIPSSVKKHHHHSFSPRVNLDDPALRHGLSRTAHEAVKTKKLAHALTPLLSGPLAVVTFPTVSTEHLKTALSILAPNAPRFPAPSRRLNPGYHDPIVQAGLQKLILLGARVEGRVFDLEGTRWVGSIEGGADGLRGQLVALLQSFGAGITNALEGAGRSLYITMESRKTMMEEEGKGEEEGKEGKQGN